MTTYTIRAIVSVFGVTGTTGFRSEQKFHNYEKGNNNHKKLLLFNFPIGGWFAWSSLLSRRSKCKNNKTGERTNLEENAVCREPSRGSCRPGSSRDGTPIQLSLGQESLVWNSGRENDANLYRSKSMST